MVTSNTSQRIKFVRVVAILLVTIVHLSPNKSLLPGDSIELETLRYFCVTILGYASVPILSVVSGYLFFEFYGRKNFLNYVLSKSRTLLLPFVFWNLIFILFIVALSEIGFESIMHRQIFEKGVLNSLFGVSTPPANFPLFFIRDLFVILLISPIVLYVVRLSVPVAILIPLCMYFGQVGEPVIFRPVILLFFVVGICLNYRRVNLDLLDDKIWGVLVLAIAFWCLEFFIKFQNYPDNSLYLRDNVADLVFDLFNRSFVILLLWIISSKLLENHSVSSFIQRQEPKAFLIFLSHLLVIYVLSGFVQVMFAGHNKYSYMIMIPVLPPLCLLAANIVWPVLRHCPKQIQYLVAGKSVK